MTSEATFQPLGYDEEPTPGLFFLQLGDLPLAETIATAATGMAFMVRNDGTLATCAHVVQAMKARPGSTLRLHGCISDLPVSVEAEVLTDGWFGPPWSAQSSYTKNPYWETIVDHRPDTMQQDLAFLRLKPETARFSDFRATVSGKPIAANAGTRNATEQLLATARVLPSGVPGYPSGSKAPLLAWHTAWYQAGVDLRSGEAQFVATFPKLWDTIRFESASVTHGFSGSPLWDGTRRLVVGMVRRGHNSTIPDAVIGTDSRAFGRLYGISMQFDRALAALIETLKAIVRTSAPPRHFSLVTSGSELVFVEPQIRRVALDDPLVNDKAKPEPMPALAALEQMVEVEQRILLYGPAGSGKSTLLYHLADRLTETPLRTIRDRYVLPMIVPASDILSENFDLVALLKTARRRLGSGAFDEETLDNTLTVNDAGLLLLVDALDENVPYQKHSAILAKLGAMVKSNPLVLGVVVTTRPGGTLKFDADGRNAQHFALYDLLTFDADKVSAFVDAAFSDTEERDRFSKWLREARWDRRGPTPLQLAMAAAIFQRAGGHADLLPKRAIDLSFVLIESLLAQAAEADHTADTARAAKGSMREPTSYSELYRPNAEAILGLLAELSLEEEDHSQPLEQRLAASAKQGDAPSWLKDTGGLLQFVEQSPGSFGGLLTASANDLDGDELRLRWLHRTIIEAGAAKRATTTLSDDAIVAFVEKLVRRQASTTALIVLACLERHEKSDLTRRILATWLGKPQTNVDTATLAIRALGAGLDGGPDMRQRLVDKLVAMLLVDPRTGAISCSEIFSRDDIPSPLEIAKKPELRDAVVVAMRNRFRFRDPRLRRDPRNRSWTLTAREIKLIEELALWGEAGIPQGAESAESRLPAVAVTRPAPAITPSEGELTAYTSSMNSTTLTVRRRDGSIADFEIDSMQFISQIVELARSRSTHLSARELLSLYAHYLVNLSDR
jgi:hypothetical protein